jgi:hypothetical protein
MDRRLNQHQLRLKLAQKAAKQEAEQQAILAQYNELATAIRQLSVPQERLSDLENMKNFTESLKLYNTKFKELCSRTLKLTIITKEKIEKDIDFTKAILLINMPLIYKSKNIDKLLEILEIDLANFTYESPAVDRDRTIISEQYLEHTAVAIFVDRMYNIWSKDNQQEAKDLLEYFIQKGLPLNNLQIRNNVLMYAIVEYLTDTEFLKIFIESKLLNINSVITPHTDDFRAESIYCLTPFSVAAAALNEELIFLMLENGADPFLADRETLKLCKHTDRFSFAEDSLVIAEPDPIKFLQKLNSIVSKFYLNKLEKFQADLQRKQETIAKIVEIAAIDKITAEEPEAALTFISPQTATSKAEILEEFADFKEELSQKPNLPQESRAQYVLEALFLRYIQTKDESIKTQIDELLAKNPSTKTREFYHQILSDVVGSDEHAGEVFTSRTSIQNYYELVQKLFDFQPQTSRLVSVVEEEAQKMILAESIYKIEGTQRIFISVPQNLLDGLPENQRTTIETFLQNPKFIAATSKAKNGIKHYANDTYKLKTAKTDIGLVATKSFVDDKGNTLIIFDQICNHKDLDRSTKGGTITKLADITDLIYAAPCGSNSDHNSDVPPPTPLELYPDGTALFPEETPTLVGDAEYCSE